MNSGNVTVTEFFPSTLTQWTVRAIETAAAGGSWMLTANTYCVAGT